MIVCRTTICPRCDCPVLARIVDEANHSQFCYNCGLEYVNGDIPAPSYGIMMIAYKNGTFEATPIPRRISRRGKELFRTRIQSAEIDKSRSYLTELNQMTFQIHTIHFRK